MGQSTSVVETGGGCGGQGEPINGGQQPARSRQPLSCVPADLPAETACMAGRAVDNCSHGAAPAMSPASTAVPKRARGPQPTGSGASPTYALPPVSPPSWRRSRPYPAYALGTPCQRRPAPRCAAAQSRWAPAADGRLWTPALHGGQEVGQGPSVGCEAWIREAAAVMAALEDADPGREGDASATRAAIKSC